MNLKKNIAGLMLVQGMNYIIPVITVPYLFRVIGVEKYGLVTFATAFALYLQVFIDYGFNLSATRTISRVRGDAGIINRIVSEVMTVKLVFCLAGFVVLLCCIVFIPKLRHEPLIFLASYGAVVGYSLFPQWFFQGMERMEYITLYNTGARLVPAVLVFFVVQSPDEYYRLPLLNAIGSTIGCLACLIILFTVFGVRLSPPAFAGCMAHLREGWSIFVSQLFGSFFNNANSIVLGFVSGNEAVAIYSGAEKVVRALANVSVPVCTAIFPRASILFSQSREQGTAFLRKFLAGGVLMHVPGCVMLFLFSGTVSELLMGSPSREMTAIIRILAVLPATVFIDNIYGTQVLLNIGQEKLVMRGIIVAGSLSVVSMAILMPLFGEYGAAFTYLIAELTILVCMIYFTRKSGISLLYRGRVNR